MRTERERERKRKRGLEGEAERTYINVAARGLPGHENTPPFSSRPRRLNGLQTNRLPLAGRRYCYQDQCSEGGSTCITAEHLLMRPAL